MTIRNSTTQIISALACTLLVGFACDTSNPEEQATARVYITGADGQEIKSEQIDFVRYRLLSQDPHADVRDNQKHAAQTSEAFCIDNDCQEWVLGTSEAGLFEIEASYCGRLQSTIVSVDFAEGSERAATEDVTFTFNPVLCQEPTLDAPLTLGQSDEVPQGAKFNVEDTICDLKAHPSAYVYVARRFGDYLKLEPVDELRWRYVDDGDVIVEEGFCQHPSEEGCAAWSVGWERPGRIEIFTEWCNAEVSETIFVPKTDDGCHVETQYVTLLVETRGCLSTNTTEEPPSDDISLMP